MGNWAVSAGITNTWITKLRTCILAEERIGSDVGGGAQGAIE